MIRPFCPTSLSPLRRRRGASLSTADGPGCSAGRSPPSRRATDAEVHRPLCPRLIAAPPMAGSRFMTTKPALQMLHEPVRDDPGHHLPAVANLLSAAVAQGEGKRFGEVFGRGGFQVDGLGGYGGYGD